MKFISQVQEFIFYENGSTVTEYAIIGSLISILVIGVVAGIGETMNDMYYDKVQEGFAGR